MRPTRARTAGQSAAPQALAAIAITLGLLAGCRTAARPRQDEEDGREASRGGEMRAPSLESPVAEDEARPAPPPEEQEPVLDLSKVDLSAVNRFEHHGRVDVAYVHFGSTKNVDGYELDQVLPISPGLWGQLRLLDRLFVVGEVEYDGLEESVEIDQAVFRMDVVDELLTVRLGRYYFPFGLERHYYSPSRNTLVDRPAAFRQVYPGTYSDNGLFVEGAFVHHTSWKLGYELAVTQGLQGFDSEDTPKTLRDNNDTPQVGGRVSFSPRQELTFGGSYTIGYWDDDDDRVLDFFGVDARLEVFELEVRAEYVGGRVEDTREFSDVFRQGWYIHVQKELEIGLPYLDALVPVFRVDWIDANDERPDFLDVTRYSFGLAAFVREDLQCKVQFELNDERGRDVSNNGLLTQIVFHW